MPSATASGRVRLCPADAGLVGLAPCWLYRSQPCCIVVARSRRHRVSCGDVIVDALPVIRAIGRERSNRAYDLVEQGADLRGVIDVTRAQVAATIRPVSASTPMCSLRQERRAFVPCFSSSHLPDPHSFSPVLPTNRCTGAEPAAPPESRPGGSGSMVRHRQSGAGQSDDGANQRFRLAQRQAEQGPQRQRRGNGQGRVERRAASRSTWLGLPGRYRRVRKPDGQTTALTQGRIICGGVRRPMPLLGDVVATIGVALNGKGRASESGRRPAARSYTNPGRADPCNVCRRPCPGKRKRRNCRDA